MNAFMAGWGPLLQTLAISMIRPLGVLLLLPVMNVRMIGSVLVRNALALLIALPVLPHALAFAPAVDVARNGLGPLIPVICSELSIGLVIGLLASIPFWAISVAGELIDTVRGSGLAEIFNPTSGGEVSLFSVLFLQLLAALFFISGGFNQLLDAIYRSYGALPIGKSLSWNQDTAHFIIMQSRLLFDLGVGFALPVVAVMMLVDFSLGLINRTAEQLEVFFVAMPIKSLLACLTLMLSIKLALGDALKHFGAIWSTVRQLLP